MDVDIDIVGWQLWDCTKKLKPGIELDVVLDSHELPEVINKQPAAANTAKGGYTGEVGEVFSRLWEEGERIVQCVVDCSFPVRLTIVTPERGPIPLKKGQFVRIKPKLWGVIAADYPALVRQPVRAVVTKFSQKGENAKATIRIESVLPLQLRDSKAIPKIRKES